MDSREQACRYGDGPAADMAEYVLKELGRTGEYPTQGAIAAAVGVSRPTVERWMARVRLKVAEAVASLVSQ